MDQQISRRDFLTLARDVLTGATVVNLYRGLKLRYQPQPLPSDTIVKSPLPTPTLAETQLLSEQLTDAEIKEVAGNALVDYNNVLETNLPEEVVKNDVIVLSDLAQYQQIIAQNEEGYVPQDEIQRPAITTDPDRNNQRKIYIYSPSLAYFARSLPANDEGRQGRRELVKSLFTHEFTHYNTKPYDSPELKRVVYEQMMGNVMRGHLVESGGYVNGAVVEAKVDGKIGGFYHNIEEVEASLIGDYVMRQSEHRFPLTHFVAESLGLGVQANLYKEMLAKLDSNTANNMRNLSRFRTEEGGRENFGRLIGSKFNIPSADQLIFGMNLLYVIDLGNRAAYDRLITPSK